jgi:hypothetical protein
MAGEEQRSGNLWSGFDSKAHLARFLGACAFFLILLTLCSWFLFSMLGITVSSPSIRIGIADQNLSGSIRALKLSETGLEIETRDGARIATVLVPADNLWIDSGLDVRPGSKVTLYATGDVNLNRFTPSSIAENPYEAPPEGTYHLAGPSGERIDGHRLERAANILRGPIALAPSERLGTLIGAVGPGQEPPRDQIAGARKFTIQSTQSGGQLHSGAPGRLFLSVNDLLWIDTPDAREQWLLRRGERGQALSDDQARRNIRDAYLPATATPAQIAERQRWAAALWDRLGQMSFRDYFYHDNSGFYMVTIMITPPPEGD